MDSGFLTSENKQVQANTLQKPTIALSVQWHTFAHRFDWATENGFALEYAPNAVDVAALPEHVTPYLKQGIPVRYHGFFPGYEIGSINAEQSQRAMTVHFNALKAMTGLGRQVITVHIGLDPRNPIDPRQAVRNLSRLVERAEALGITVSIENLRLGISSDPQTLARWAEQSGCMLTLDIGHAACCEQTRSGLFCMNDFLDIFSDRLIGVHMYEAERDRHYPPEDMSVLGPVVDRLLQTKCDWWTIELIDHQEVLHTRRLLLDYMAATPESLVT